MAKNKQADTDYSEFERDDVIRDVADKKRNARYLSIDQQAGINKMLFGKLMLLRNEIEADPLRPEIMQEADSFFKSMHGERIRQLHRLRRSGTHIVSLFCHAVPPELIYAIPESVAVPICCGGSELQTYASPQLHEACSLTQSMSGFLNTGMCVLHNVADHALNLKHCGSFSKMSEIPDKKPEAFKVWHLPGTEHPQFASQLLASLQAIASPQSLDTARFIQHAAIFSEIRQIYQRINELRALPIPPLNGNDAIWLLQLYLAVEPEQLKNYLLRVEEALLYRSKHGIGYHTNQSKKRVLMLAARQMPPFGQFYRLIENNGGIVVHERSCLGPESVNYDFSELAKLASQSSEIDINQIDLLFAKPDTTARACSASYHLNHILNDLTHYRIDAVIAFGFDNCASMQLKSEGIKRSLERQQVPMLQLQSDYENYYTHEQEYAIRIAEFLSRQKKPTTA